MAIKRLLMSRSCSSAAGASKPNGLVTAGTSLTFAAPANGRRKWTAVFTFADPPAGRADGLTTGAQLAVLVLRTSDPSMSVAQVDGTQALTIVEFLQGGGPAEVPILSHVLLSFSDLDAAWFASTVLLSAQQTLHLQAYRL